MNELTTYNFDSSEVRILVRDSEPWFVGKDVASVLGYSNPRDAITRHVDEDDKAGVGIHDGSQMREVIVINESGLYSLILRSKLESAKKFKHWVTSEVLPQIRKTGAYAPEPPKLYFDSKNTKKPKPKLTTIRVGEETSQLLKILSEETGKTKEWIAEQMILFAAKHTEVR